MKNKIVLTISAGLLALPVALFAAEPPPRPPMMNGPATAPPAQGNPSPVRDMKSMEQPQGAPGSRPTHTPPAQPPTATREKPCERPAKDGTCLDPAPGGQGAGPDRNPINRPAPEAPGQGGTQPAPFGAPRTR